jgi:hypothetical protein
MGYLSRAVREYVVLFEDDLADEFRGSFYATSAAMAKRRAMQYGASRALKFIGVESIRWPSENSYPLRSRAANPFPYIYA